MIDLLLGVLLGVAGSAQAACTPNTTSTSGLQNLLRAGGAGYNLQLCAGQAYALSDVLNYTAPNQVSRVEDGVEYGLPGCEIRSL
jgi:hypothetical protein